jgi:arylsulfatase A-like enzyme
MLVQRRPGLGQTLVKKNVLIFYTDQQRADSLGCMGNSMARTPNLDALAACGVLYTNHYASNPVCMPSRASFFTGRTILAHRLLDNGIFLPESELTLPEIFRRSGYRTASIGKLHFQTYKHFDGSASMEDAQRWASGELDAWSGPYYGFENVLLTTGHGERTGGHYGRWREKAFPDLQLGPDNALGGVFREFGCYKSALPVEAHHSTWIADRAVDFLDRAADAPFFLFVSFPDPHHPFTPPAPWCNMFDGVDFPPPHAVPGENDAKPKPYRDAMIGNPFPTDGGARFFPNFTAAARNAVLAHTCAMISLIDHSVGRVLAKLVEKGLADSTVVVFTSDHGDFLGDHHFLYKAQMPCRALLRVPLIIAQPGGAFGVSDAVSSNIDVMPTLLAACGIDVPEVVQGVVLPGPGEKPRRDYAFEAGWSKASPDYHHFTIYKQDWRISYFPHLADGELYDLRADPHEHVNLFHDARHRRTRNALLQELLSAAGSAEPTMPPVLTDW